MLGPMNPPRRRALRRPHVTFFACCAALAALGVTKVGFAQDLAAAANAFSRAQKAELAGDHDSAAELYELADSLAPTPEALRSALRARRAAGQLGTAALDAEKLINRYPDDRRSRELADATLEEAKKKLMRLEVKCHPRACGVVLDNAAASADTSELQVIYVEAGDHRVIAAFGQDRSDPQVVHGKAGDHVSLTFNAPPERHLIGGPAGAGGNARAGALGSADRGVVTGGGGLPVWVFAVGAVATVGLGATTIWSAVDVLQANSTYEHNITTPPPGYNATAAYNDGRTREMRTNFLVGATVVAAVSTTVIGVFTRWGGSREGQRAQTATNHLEVSGGAAPAGGNLQLSGSF
jgi:hypothetical protein